MKRLVLSIMALAVAILSGCPAEQNTGGPSADRPLMPADKLPKGKRYALLVYMRMMTVSVPVGTVSGSENLWSYLDEERVEAIRSASLGRNGLRAGVVERDGWKDFQELLEEMTGRPLKMTTMVSRPGEPMFVTLKQRQPIQTLFVFSDDRTLAGRDYPPGDNLLTLSCTLNQDDPSKVMVTGLPQIRTTAHRPKFVAGPGLPGMVSRPDFYGFDAATFRVLLPSRDVLVVGPGSASRRRSSLGYALLVGENDGVEYETVVILIPEVFATPIR